MQPSNEGYGKFLIGIIAVSHQGQGRSPMWTQDDLLPSVGKVSMGLPQGPGVVINEGRKRLLALWPSEASKKRPRKL